jgi:hypothetical protein
MNKRTREEKIDVQACRDALRDGLRKWFDYLAPGDEKLQADIEKAYNERVKVLQEIAIKKRITPEFKNSVRAEYEAKKKARNPTNQAQLNFVPPGPKLHAMLSFSSSATPK